MLCSYVDKFSLFEPSLTFRSEIDQYLLKQYSLAQASKEGKAARCLLHAHAPGSYPDKTWGSEYGRILLYFPLVLHISKLIRVIQMIYTVVEDRPPEFSCM